MYMLFRGIKSGLNWIKEWFCGLSNEGKIKVALWITMNMGAWWVITGLRCMGICEPFTLSELWFPSAIWFLGALIFINFLVACIMYLDC